MKFDSETFAVLGMVSYEKKYTEIGIAEINELEALIKDSGEDPSSFIEVFAKLMTFLAALGEPVEITDPDHLLTVIAEDGVFSRVYGAAIFRNDEGDRLLLKSGGSIYEVSISEGKLICGDMKGSLTVTCDESSTIHGTVSFRIPKQKEPYNIPLVLNSDIEIGEGDLTYSLEEIGTVADFAQYLKPVGGTPGVKLSEMDLGEYLVLGIEEGQTNEYGRNFSLDVQGVGKVYCNKALNNMLCLNGKVLISRLNQGKPITLKVSKKETMKNGNIAVTAGLQMREPNGAQQAIAPAKQQALLASA
jgi:hypothetical protein